MTAEAAWHGVRNAWWASRISAQAILSLAMLSILAVPGWTQQKADDLADRRMEDLMNIAVASVSRLEYLNTSGLRQSRLVKRGVYGKLSWQL